MTSSVAENRSRLFDVPCTDPRRTAAQIIRHLVLVSLAPLIPLSIGYCGRLADDPALIPSVAGALDHHGVCTALVRLARRMQDWLRQLERWLSAGLRPAVSEFDRP